MESCIARGVDGILFVPTDSSAIVDTVERARAKGHSRDRARYAARAGRCRRRDFRNRQFQGWRADRRLGAGAARSRSRDGEDRLLEPAAEPADVSTCCAIKASCSGFGIALADPRRIGDESDPRNVVSGRDQRQSRRRPPCDGELPPAKEPNIRVVYAINEPAAAGAHEALRALGKARDVVARVRRRRLPRRAQRCRRRDRRDCAAVPARDGRDGCRSRRNFRSHWPTAGGAAGARLRGYGDRARHRSTRGRSPIDRQPRRSSPRLLGLKARAGPDVHRAPRQKGRAAITRAARESRAHCRFSCCCSRSLRSAWCSAAHSSRRSRYRCCCSRLRSSASSAQRRRSSC